MSETKNDENDFEITKTQAILIAIFSVFIGCIFVCVVFAVLIIAVLSRPNTPEILNRATHSINSMFSFVKEIKPLSTTPKIDTVVVYRYQQASKESFKIGDTVKTDDFIITLNSCQYQDSVRLEGSSGVEGNTPNLKYLIFNVKYKNINNKDEGLAPYEDEAFLNYSGKKFILKKAQLENDVWGGANSKIGPLGSKVKSFVYTIPEDEMKNPIFWIPNINSKETFYVCDQIVPGKISPNTDSNSNINEMYLDSDNF